MPNTLFRYCICYKGEVGKDAVGVDDAAVFDRCDRLYLIDGQYVNFEDALTAVYKNIPDKGKELLNRDFEYEVGADKANDSIQYQQIRAIQLADALIDQAKSFVSTDSETQKLKSPSFAVIGGGIAGVTFALRVIARHKEAKVTIFENHAQLFARLYKSFGREVSPYHHLRLPEDDIISDGGAYNWVCPFKGGYTPEQGGIPEVLEWRAGEVSHFIEDLDRQYIIKKKKSDGRLSEEKKTSVIEVAALIEDRKRVFRVGEDKVAGRSGHMPDNEKSDGPRRFDAVVLAPGGGRDVSFFQGQTNAEYWRPHLIENLPPINKAYKVAIIGGGNTAASELFNCLFTERSFIGFLNFLNTEIDDDDKDLLEQLKATAVKKTISVANFHGKFQKLAKRLIEGNKYIYADSRVKVALIVRGSSDDDGHSFGKMNGINRYLTRLLVLTGRVKLVIAPEEEKSKFPKMAYSVVHRDNFSGVHNTAEDEEAYRTNPMVIKCGGELLEKILSVKNYKLDDNFPNEGWDWVINCIGPVRRYAEMFEGSSPSLILGKGEEVAEATVDFKKIIKDKIDWIAGKNPEAKK